MSSELAQLTAAVRIIPDLPAHTLSRFGIGMIGEAEDEFERAHRAGAASAAAGLPESLRRDVIAAAEATVRDGWFSYGMPGYDRKAHAASCLPFLLWVCLRPLHPSITREQAAALITPRNEWSVAAVVREMMGYDLTGAAKKDAPTDRGGPSDGANSTPPPAPSGPPSPSPPSET